MSENKPDKSDFTSEAFDILNQEFKQHDLEKENAKRVERLRQKQAVGQTQISAGGKNKSATKKQQEDYSEEEPSGSGCVTWGWKLFLVIFLAALLAWIVFMPDGSLKELRDYAKTKVSYVMTWVSDTVQAKLGGSGDAHGRQAVSAADQDAQTTAAETAAQTSAAEDTTAITTTEATTAAVTTAAAATTTARTQKTTTAAKTTTTTAAENSVPESDLPQAHITVYLKSQIVVIYDSNGDVVRACICSTGKAATPTRTGTYSIRAKYRWRLMIGNCYTQYASSISSSYLLHSIPYNKKNAGTMSNASYDKLGTPASSGCTRLCFRDSKWIYDNCPIGTPVYVVNEAAPEGIVPLAVPPRIDDAVHSGWDPTDDAPENPYNN